MNGLKKLNDLLFPGAKTYERVGAGKAVALPALVKVLELSRPYACTGTILLLMLLYNGQRGSGHKQLFYWFYPAHVYLLYGASCLLYNVLR